MLTSLIGGETSLVAQMVKHLPTVWETWVQSLDWEYLGIGEGHGNLLQYSCLENSMDSGAWWATVHGVSESDMTEQLTHTHCYNDQDSVLLVSR